MDNPEKQATLGTRHRTKTTKQKIQRRKPKKMSNTAIIKHNGWRGTRCLQRVSCEFDMTHVLYAIKLINTKMNVIVPIRSKHM